MEKVTESDPKNDVATGADVKKARQTSRPTYDDVVSRLSHEIGTPITALRGYVSLWLDGTLDPMPWCTKDEITILARQLDSLAQNVGALVDSLARSSTQENRGVFDGWSVNAIDEFAGPIGGIRRRLQEKNRSLLHKMSIDSQNAAMVCERSAILLDALATQLANAHTVSGGHAPEMLVMDLSSWLRQSIHDLAPAVTCFGHPLTLEFPSESVVMKGNASLLSVALLNLLDNAQKFSPERSPIQVIGFAKAGTCGFAVEDAGPGLPRAFEFRPFGRIDDGPGFAAPGVGLGLFTASRIAELHGGALTIRTVERMGTSVRIQIPVQRDNGSHGG
jgi:signal transduction histidine kinase